MMAAVMRAPSTGGAGEEYARGMSILAKRHVRRRWLLLALLPALALRLLIPAGYMPADAAPLSLQICPEGFPAALLQHAGHHHHHAGGGAHGAGGHAGGAHCVFAGAGAGGPIAYQTAQVVRPAAEPLAPAAYRAPVLPVRLVHLPEARGPPVAV